MYKYRLWIVIMIMSLMIVCLVMLLSVNDVAEMQDRIEGLEYDIETESFQTGVAEIKVGDLKQIVIDLEDVEEMNVLYKEMLHYCVAYIRYLQIDMASNGLDYPEFIIDSVLTDEFFDELQEQEEYFEEMDGQ